MNEKQDLLNTETGRRDMPDVDSTRYESNDADIGKGKKTAVYGCGFMILAVIIIFIVLALTGFYNPFQGTEGVGP